MGRKIKHHAKLVERCFSRVEWEYLKRHKEFQAQMGDCCETLEDVEKLSLLGDRLLRKWEDANPSKPRFKRVQ